MELGPNPLKRPHKDPSPATKKDRERVDFSRFPPKTPLPTPGVSYLSLLDIATRVCGREIRELKQMSKGELQAVRRLVEKEKHD